MHGGDHPWTPCSVCVPDNPIGFRGGRIGQITTSVNRASTRSGGGEATKRTHVRGSGRTRGASLASPLRSAPVVIHPGQIGRNQRVMGIAENQLVNAAIGCWQDERFGALLAYGINS